MNVNQNTKTYFLNLWLRNYIFNLEHLSKENVQILDLTQKQLQGGYVLFCGASPILETQAKFIHRFRNKFFLISSDTSASYLISQDIYPDAVLSIDSSRGTIFHLRENLPEDIKFFTWLGGNREIFFRSFKKYLFFTTFPLDQILQAYFYPNQPILENPSLNVAGLAKAIALSFGAKKIIYAGISFTSQNHKTHCRGTGYENYLIPKITRKFSFEAYRSGYKEVKTVKNSLAFQEIFKDEFSLLWEDVQFESLEPSSLKKNFTVSSKVGVLEFLKIINDKKIFIELTERYSFPQTKLRKYLSYFQ